MTSNEYGRYLTTGKTSGTLCTRITTLGKEYQPCNNTNSPHEYVSTSPSHGGWVTVRLIPEIPQYPYVETSETTAGAISNDH